VALRPRLLPGVPLSRDCLPEIRCGTGAVKCGLESQSPGSATASVCYGILGGESRPRSEWSGLPLKRFSPRVRGAGDGGFILPPVETHRGFGWLNLELDPSEPLHTQQRFYEGVERLRCSDASTCRKEGLEVGAAEHL
jgi:hypothetical protein